MRLLQHVCCTNPTDRPANFGAVSISGLMIGNARFSPRKVVPFSKARLICYRIRSIMGKLNDCWVRAARTRRVLTWDPHVSAHAACVTRGSYRAGLSNYILRRDCSAVTSQSQERPWRLMNSAMSHAAASFHLTAVDYRLQYTHVLHPTNILFRYHRSSTHASVHTDETREQSNPSRDCS